MNDPEAFEIERVINRVLDDLRILDEWLTMHNEPFDAERKRSGVGPWAQPSKALQATYQPRQWIGGIQRPAVTIEHQPAAGGRARVMTTGEALTSVMRILNAIKEAER